MNLEKQKRQVVRAQTLKIELMLRHVYTILLMQKSILFWSQICMQRCETNMSLLFIMHKNMIMRLRR